MGPPRAAAAVPRRFDKSELFEHFMPLDALIASFSEYIPVPQTKLDMTLWNAVPFHLRKGLEHSLVTLLVFPKLAPLPRGR